jgi:2-C-methyl-D-erythritol 4-phosphate cytidylyltransferase
VVIVAAGRGSRARGGAGGAGGSGGGAAAETPKQYRLLAGQPLLLRALRPFIRHPRVGPIVVVLPPEDVDAPPPWLAALRSERLLVAAGGEERQQSVANGLRRLPAGPSLVLVHDAARPFVEPELIDRVLAVAALGAAAVPGLPLSDTVKETDAAGWVVRTVPRERLVAVQTPQAFPRAMLETAHQGARGGAEGGVAGGEPAAGPATDDAALCERLGHPVRIVAGSARNLKVTTAEDFALAEAIAAAEGP